MTDEEERMIGEVYKYSGKSARQIAFAYKLHPETIAYLLRKRLGIHATKSRRINLYRVNSKAFDILDEKSAYWLGFLYADGCTTPDGTLAINLSLVDKDHLERFLAFLESDYPIHNIPPRKHGNPYGIAEINIRDRHLVKRLRDLGIVAYRTKLEYLKANLPHYLYNHFLRGLFDGDGHRRKNGRYGVGFAGKEDTLELVREILSSEVGTSRTIKICKSWNGRGYYVEYGGKPQVNKICTWLYANATVWLPRKRLDW